MPLPASSTISTYDGAGKVNDQSLPPANDQLDWSNPQLATGIGDVAGLTQTTPRIWVRLTLAASTGALVLNNWRAVWQNVSPTPVPILARTGTGVFTITLPTFVSDEYDQSIGVDNNIQVNLIAAVGSIEGSTPGFINCQASGNVITLHAFSSAGSANDLVGLTVTVMGFQVN
jgi:hypothetical protein